MANAEVTDCMPDSAEVNRSSGRNRVCKRCNYTTSDGKEFLHHQLNAHKAEATEIHPCDDCDFTTASYTDLQKHRKIHIVPARNQRLASNDSESGRTVEERVDKILQKSKSNEAESQEVEDDDASSSKSGLSTKIYTCQDCGANTVSARKHLRHQVDEHQYDFIIHECDMCEYATKNKLSWTQHMKSHLGGGSTPSSRSNTPVTMVPLTSTIPRIANDANISIKDEDVMSLQSDKDMYDENSNTPKREAEKGSYSEIKERLNKGIVREENNNKENSAFKALQESLNLKPVYNSFRENLKAATESGLPDSTAESSAFASDLEAEESSLVIDFQEEEKLKPAPSPAPIIPTVTTSTPVIMKPKSHVREAVDPAKYIKVHDTEGVKYACSKCGNLYKWRKSLNKHWKEKHDGEIPTPATSQIFTQLNIPRVNPKQTGNALKSFQTIEANSQHRGSPNVVPTIEIFARPSPVSSVKPSPTGLSIVRQRNEGMKNSSSKSPHIDGRSNRMSLGEPFNSYLDKQLSNRERKGGDNVQVHRLSFSPGIPPVAHTQSFKSRRQMRTPTPPLENEPMDLSNAAKPASYNWQQKPRAPIGEVLDLSTKGSKKTGHTPISTPVDFSRRESLPASFGRRDHYHDRFSSPQGSDKIRNCPKCAFTTRSEEAYIVHMEVHLSKRSYKCAQCELVFVTNDELNEHFSNMHYDVVPQFSNAKELSPTTANDAPNMGDVGENLQLYKYLTQNQEQQKQYICMVCGLGYKWKWDLGRHFKNMHPSLNNPYSKRKPTEDDDVQIIDDSPHANKRYRQNDNGGNVEFQCKRCSFSSRNQSEMTKHNLIHSLEKTYYCNSCSFNSKSKEEFMLHMRHAHKVNIDGDTAMRFAQSGIRATESIQGDPGKMPTFDMEIDGGENDSSYPLSLTPNQMGRPRSPSESNMLEDGTEIVFPQAPERGSPDLQQTPPRNGSKLKPPKNSSAEMLLPYKCTACEYRARWPSEITQHMKNHSDEKPFHCPRCSYKSKWKWDVVKHLKRCGGGTVKDVIDTTKLKRPLNFQNSPGKNGAILSNGPPNVTVMKDESSSSNAESLSVYQAGYIETESNSEEHKRYYNPISEDNENSMEGFELSDSSSSISFQDMVPSQSPAGGKQKQSRKPLLPKTIIGLGQHGCNKCPFIGNSPAELKRHSRVHSDEKPFMCRTCGYSTKWKCDLKKHIKTYDHVAAHRPEDSKKSEKSGTDDNNQETDDMEDDDGPFESAAVDIPKPHLYKCEKCQYVTYKKNFMDSHMKIHEKPTTMVKKPGGGKFKCKQCTFTCDDLAGFMQHKLVHTTGAQNAETKNTNDLSILTPKKEEANDKNENNNKHRRKQVKPGYRHGQAFNEEGAVDVTHSFQEIDTMGKAGDLTCFSCPFTTDSEAILEKHVDNHGSQQRYECEFCDWSVDTLKTLYFHAKSVHAKELSSMNKAEYLEKVCAKANSSSEFMAMTDLEAINSLMNSEADGEENKNTPQRFERVKEMEVSDYVTSPGSPNSTRSKRNRKIRTCQKCGYVTDNMTNLQRHLDKHGQNAKYMCNYCDYSLDRLGLVQLHMKTIHTKEWFAAQKKDYPGDDKITWKSKQNKMLSPDLEDMVSESGESYSSQGDDVISKKRDLTISKISQYVCPHCPFITSNMAAFTTHVTYHGSNLEFTCEMCNFSQDSAKLIVDHMKQVHQVDKSELDEIPSKNKQQIKIESKQNKTKRMKKLKLHLNALNARKNYQCTLCPYTSFVKNAVIKHKRMRHLKPNKYQCHLCQFNSTRVAPLHQHLAFHKSGFSDKRKSRSKDVSKTNESPKVMSTRSSSVSSTSSKSGSTPKGKYVCEHCPYSCKVQAELKKHLKLHNGKLKFKCKHCTYSIDRSHFLQNHEKMHEEEIKDGKRRKSTSRERKPVKAVADTHQCKQCAFKSQSAKHLEDHIKCHSDPSFCHLCPYSNKDPKTLDDHKDKHDSNGNFKCMSCDFAVDKISLLCQHVKVHNYPGFRQSTLENNLMKRKKCPRCPYHSTSVTELDAHKQKHLRKSKMNSSSETKVTRSQANSNDSKVDGKRFYYKCTSCPYQTNNKGNFENHRGQHGVEQKLSCPYCDYGSPLTGQLYSHIKIHFPGTTLTSNILKVLSSKVNEISDPGNATAQEIIDLESQFLLVEGAAENEVDTNQTGSATPKKTSNIKSHFICAYCDEKLDTREKVISHEKKHF